MSKKGIGPVLGGLIASLASGLLSKKKDRDAATPKKAGILRDIGISAVAATGGSMALSANGVISCDTYGLEQAFCNGAHGLLLIAGMVMYWIGQGRKEPSKSDTDDGIRN